MTRKESLTETLICAKLGLCFVVRTPFVRRDNSEVSPDGRRNPTEH